MLSPTRAASELRVEAEAARSTLPGSAESIKVIFIPEYHFPSSHCAMLPSLDTTAIIWPSASHTKEACPSLSSKWARVGTVLEPRSISTLAPSPFVLSGHGSSLLQPRAVMVQSIANRYFVFFPLIFFYSKLCSPPSSGSAPMNNSSAATKTRLALSKRYR